MGETREKRAVVLTQQQVEILVQVARGVKRRTIALELHLHPSTVTYHVGRLQRAFAAPGLAPLACAAMVAGILVNNTWPIEASGELIAWIDVD